VFSEKLERDGFSTIGQLQAHPADDLIRRYGETGARLARLARGEDARKITPDGDMKSVSCETTFNTDLADFETLCTELLALSERLSERLKAKDLVGHTVTLKLKSAGFRLLTRARPLIMPTQLANVLYENGRALLAREVDGTAFRLIGIGVAGLERSGGADAQDLLDPGVGRRAAAERAMDRLRNRFGREAIVRGKLYRAPGPQKKT
jgi:DNA polymerase-4